MSYPIRVLHVFGALNYGGAETMIMNLYRQIDRSKIQFDFVVHTDKKCDYFNEIAELGGRIFVVPRYKGKNHFFYKKAWENFFRAHSEYKIIHGHIRSTASIYLKIAKKYGLVTIAHSHSTDSRGNTIEKIVKNIMQYQIRYIADHLLACSDEAGKWLFGKDVINKENYKVIKNAIDVEKYIFDEVKRDVIRKKLGINDKFVLGHVGSFTYPKNHKFLIDVFYQVQKQNKNSALVLVGDGRLKADIEKQINELKIKDKVILTGEVQNVNDYMQAMDVFVFPSIFEGLGMVLIEAQASGLSCVVSDKIPNETFIIDSIEKLSLNNSIKMWAATILKYSSKFERKNTLQEIAKSGYEIKDSAQIIENFYSDIIYKCNNENR